MNHFASDWWSKHFNFIVEHCWGWYTSMHLEITLLWRHETTSRDKLANHTCMSSNMRYVSKACVPWRYSSTFCSYYINYNFLSHTLVSHVCVNISQPVLLILESSHLALSVDPVSKPSLYTWEPHPHQVVQHHTSQGDGICCLRACFRRITNL